MKENLNLIKRGIDELISEDELITKLKSKKPVEKTIPTAERRKQYHLRRHKSYLTLQQTRRSKNGNQIERQLTTKIFLFLDTWETEMTLLLNRREIGGGKLGDTTIPAVQRCLIDPLAKVCWKNCLTTLLER